MFSFILATVISVLPYKENVSHFYNPCGGIVFNVRAEALPGYKINEHGPWELVLSNVENLNLSKVETRIKDTQVTFIFESECKANKSWYLEYKLVSYICDVAGNSCLRKKSTGKVSSSN